MEVWLCGNDLVKLIIEVTLCWAQWLVSIWGWVNHFGM